MRNSIKCLYLCTSKSILQSKQIVLILQGFVEGIKREQFPILDNKPYFNTCSIGPLAIPVKKAVDDYMTKWNDHGGYAWVMEEGWNQSVDEARDLFACIIGAKPENIAYSFGNSVAFSSILSAYEFERGDNILFNELDFPSFPTYVMARSQGNLDYKVIKEENGLVRSSDYLPLVDENTRMITACEVSSNTGARINVEELSEIAQDNDVPLFLDTYQSTGVVPMDIKKLDVEFLASGCLKWLVGGFGISFLYIRDDLIEDLNPSSIGWMGVDDPFENLYDKLRTTLHRPDSALKFQYGTPYPFGAVTAAAGMKVVHDIGVAKIYEYDMNLTQEIIDTAKESDLTVQTSENPKERGSIVNVLIDNAASVVEELQKEGFILDMRSNGIRIAPHFYNNSEDVEKLFNRIIEINNAK